MFSLASLLPLKWLVGIWMEVRSTCDFVAMEERGLVLMLSLDVCWPVSAGFWYNVSYSCVTEGHSPFHGRYIWDTFLRLGCPGSASKPTGLTSVPLRYFCHYLELAQVFCAVEFSAQQKSPIIDIFSCYLWVLWPCFTRTKSGTGSQTWKPSFHCLHFAIKSMWLHTARCRATYNLPESQKDTWQETFLALLYPDPFYTPPPLKDKETKPREEETETHLTDHLVRVLPSLPLAGKGVGFSFTSFTSYLHSSCLWIWLNGKQSISLYHQRTL